MLSKAELFYRAVCLNFESAAHLTPCFERCYRIAGHVILLKFMNKLMLQKMTAALAHAEIDIIQPVDLTIHVWDSVSIQAEKLKYHWIDDYLSYGLRGEVRQHNTDDIFTLRDTHTQTLMLLHKIENKAYLWIEDERELPWWISGSPMQQIFNWWMRDRGFQLTHAGAVGYSDGGVVLAGSGGAGKSTTALTCMKAGMSFVSEDYCLLDHRDELRAHCIYSSAKLEQNTLNFYPEMNQYIDNKNRTEAEKGFLFHHQIWPEKIISHFPVKAILVLQRHDHSESKLEPVSKDEALKALAISTMWQLTHTGPATFQLLKKATDSVPCYLLYLGKHLEKIPDVIREVL